MQSGSLWTYAIRIPSATSDAERIKYSVFRGIAFCFAVILGIAAFVFSPLLFGTSLSPNDALLRLTWTAAAVMWASVWLALGSQFFSKACWIMAVGMILLTTNLYSHVSNDGTLFRTQLFLVLTLLILSIYMSKRQLYSVAVVYYLAFLACIYSVGQFQPDPVIPFTVASAFAVASIEAVTRILAAETRARERDRAQALHSSRLSTLGETTAFIMHEVSAPLSVLSLHIELAQKNENISYHLKKMQSAVERANDFIGSVKRLVRSTDSGKHEVVQLSEILKIVADLVEPSMKRKNVRLEFDYQDDVTLKCRPAEIAQVLINLVNNSADAMGLDSERSVVVSCRTHGECIEIDITDSGTGIDAAIANKIMDPFFTTKKTGTGIGLSIAQQIAAGHDGSVEVIKFKNPTVVRLRFAIQPKFTL